MRKGRSSSWIQQQLWDPRQHEFNAGAEALGTKGRSPSPRGKPPQRAPRPRAGRPARPLRPPDRSRAVAPTWLRCGAPGATPPSSTGRPGSRSRQPRAGAAARRAGHAGAPCSLGPRASRRQPTRAERRGPGAPGWTPGVGRPAPPGPATPPRPASLPLPAPGLWTPPHPWGLRGGSQRRECRAGTQSCPRLSGATLCPPHLDGPAQRRREPGASRYRQGRACARSGGSVGPRGAGRRRHLPPGPRTAPSGAPRGPRLPGTRGPWEGRGAWRAKPRPLRPRVKLEGVRQGACPGWEGQES